MPFYNGTDRDSRFVPRESGADFQCRWFVTRKYGKLSQGRKQMPEMNSVVKPISSCISLTVALSRIVVDWYGKTPFAMRDGFVCVS
ncbi:MAG TPA: hypothetical protein EYP90_12415 [Chromatiaceae bacterium]|nr:hypothetical protein [Chromatiaceae bacterium]HIP72189.1 hypothetical protein [Anaerolineae bacterium]